MKNILLYISLPYLLISCETLPDLSYADLQHYKCKVLNRDSDLFKSQMLYTNRYISESYDGAVKYEIDYKKRALTFSKLPNTLSDIVGYKEGEVARFSEKEYRACFESKDQRKSLYRQSKIVAGDSEIEFYASRIPFIGVNHTKIKLIKSKEYSLYKVKDIKDGIDWDIVKELNDQAHYIWNKKRETFKEIELIDKYFDKEIEEFINFKEDVKYTLESTDFKTEFNIRKLSHYHPLFTQVILDLFFENFKTRSLFSYQTKDKSGIVFVTSDKGALTGIELPFVNTGLIKNNLMRNYLSEDYKKAYELLDGLVDQTSISSTYIAQNTIAIVQTLSSSNCLEWGLNPEFNRVYIQGVLINESTSLDYLNHIINSNSLACGKRRSNYDVKDVFKYYHN